MNKQIVSIEAVVEMVMELKSGEYTLQIQENGGMEGAVTGREILKYLKGTKSNGYCEDEEVLERSCQYPSLKQTNGWNDVIGDGVNPKIRVLTEDFSV